MGRSILLLVSSTQRRGAEVFGEHLSGALVDSGWETGFYALKSHGPGAGVSANPILDESQETSGLRPRLVLAVRRLIGGKRPAVVLAGGGATLKYSVVALMGLRNAPALVYSSIGEPEYWAANSARRLMMSTLLRRTDMVTAVSQATADQLARGFGVAPSKVRVVHPGVPDSFLGIARPAPRSALRALFVGSLSAEKDPQAAVECVRNMQEPAILRFVGEGPLIGEMRRVGSAGRARIEVVGPVDDVRPHLGWADVLLLTSRTEGLPGVVLEAGAAGLPVVAFDVGGVAEAVSHGVTGYVHHRGDVDAMAASLDRLAGDPELRASMGRAARHLVTGHFLLDQAVARYVEVLETFVHR